MGTLCSIDSGSSNAQDAVEDAPYVLFDRSKKIKRSTRYLFDCEALIIPGEGAEFLPRYFIGKFDLHQRAYALHSFSNRIDVKYLYYYLIYQKEYWPRVAVGATVKSLRRRHFENLPVAVAPLPEQQRIVAILDESFAGLATASANAEKNLNNAQELPDAAFAFIFKNGASQWPTTTIGDQVTLQRGFDITKRQQNTGRVPVVSSGGIKSFHDAAMAKGPGVVLGRKGSLGTVYYVGQDYWPHDTTLWVKDFKGNNPKFVYYFFKGLDLAKLDSGAANPALNRNVVHPLAANWPDRDRQAEIVEQIEKVSSDAERLSSNYQQSLDSMAALKQSILQKAFSGELTSSPSQAIKEAAE